tara:strand:- start:74 stop:1165 length:1092 start_codon:yes stop_codon:yes gene_type:complete
MFKIPSQISNIFKNKKVLITGHTGFKGQWLSVFLKKMDANILGISLNTKTKPSHFKLLNLKIKNKYFDISDLKKLKKTINSYQPDFIFHLAAQALVKKSYINPYQTWSSNFNGTLNLLEVLRNYKKKVNVIMITSDKSYKNVEQKSGYKEDDVLAGIDPYSASKSAADISITSYFLSFLKNKKNISVVVARAGNVIGGGDWSEDRLIPDCVKSWSKKKTAKIRNPNSTRPWQHVLEVTWGYIILGAFLKKKKKVLNGQAFNLGPNYEKNYKVKECLKIIKNYWPNIKWKISNSANKSYESKLLKLNSKKIRKLIGWSTVLSLKQTLKMTAEWYREFYENKKIITEVQLKEYINFFYKKNKIKL